MKRVLWTAGLGIVSGLVTALTYRLAERLWRRVFHEAPPEPPKWANALFGRPARKKILGTFHVPSL